MYDDPQPPIQFDNPLRNVSAIVVVLPILLFGGLLFAAAKFLGRK
jgi:hypothetical protein